jgi:hypothetical protein
LFEFKQSTPAPDEFLYQNNKELIRRIRIFSDSLSERKVLLSPSGAYTIDTFSPLARRK